MLESQNCHRPPVILSEAKNPIFSIETLRFAQGDKLGVLQSSV